MKFHYNHAHLFIGSSKFEPSLIWQKIIIFIYLTKRVFYTKTIYLNSCMIIHVRRKKDMRT